MAKKNSSSKASRLRAMSSASGASVTDFYAFTRNSFTMEGYTPAPFEDKIPIAI